MVDFSTALAAINTGINLFSGFKASKQADKAAGQSNALNQAQIDALNKQNLLYESGGDALAQSLQSLLLAYDGRGQYDPQKIDDLAALLSQEQEQGEFDTRVDIGNSINQQKASQNQALLAELALAQSQFAPTAGNVAQRSTVDTTFNPNSYDPAVASLANAYKQNLDAVSQQNMNEAMSTMMADSQRKLGGAITGQQTVKARAMGEAMNEQNAQNSLNAINMAMKQMAGLQGMDTTLQNSNINAQGANINALNFDKNIQDMLFRQAISSANAGQNFSQQAQAGDRSNYLSAVGQLEAVNKLNQNDDFNNYNAALATLGKEQGLANVGIDTLSNVVTAPYSYKVQGPAGILSSAPNAINASNAALKTYSTAASGAFNAAGQGVDSFFKESGLGDKSIGDVLGFNSSSGTQPLAGTQANTNFDPMFGGSTTAGSNFNNSYGSQYLTPNF